jgi:hypothetical protein
MVENRLKFFEAEGDRSFLRQDDILIHSAKFQKIVW